MRTREWHRAHPEVSRRAANLRLLRKRQPIIDRYGMICHLCCGEIAPEDFSLDHVIPLAKGGLDTIENLRPAHLLCNRRKGSR